MVQETRTLVERVTMLNVKMIPKFPTQREGSAFRGELALSVHPQKILAVPIEKSDPGLQLGWITNVPVTIWDRV